MITANDFTAGNVIIMDNELYLVVNFQHVKPGKGGAFMKVKFRSLRTGNMLDRTLRPEDQFELAHIEQKEIQFLYRDQGEYHFMDQKTFEQVLLDKGVLGNATKYLKENMVISGSYYNGKFTGVNLPTTVELKVTHTEPGIKGDTAKSSGKPATLETGLVARVPLFINTGDIVKIDTRTGDYAGRA